MERCFRKVIIRDGIRVGKKERRSRREVGIPSYNRSENLELKGGVRTFSYNKNENLETEENRKMGVRTESPDDWGDLKLGMGTDALTLPKDLKQ